MKCWHCLGEFGWLSLDGLCMGCERTQIELFRARGSAPELREAPQAPLSDPARGTVNSSLTLKKSTPGDLPVPAKVLAAAIAMSKEGERVSVKAACERAGVDRSHYTKRYPDGAAIIKKMAAGDPLSRGSKQDGALEAWEDD